MPCAIWKGSISFVFKLIKARMKGQRPKLVATEEPRQADVVDLMERLRQSLETRNRRPANRTASRRKKSKTRHAA